MYFMYIATVGKTGIGFRNDIKSQNNKIGIISTQIIHLTLFE